jgi:Branched-chain amino acid transport protein (AzlD)
VNGGDTWAVIGALAVGTFAIKAAGPAVLGQRPLPDRLGGVIALLAPALLSGLVVFEAFSGSQTHHIVLDARAVGLLAAIVGRLLRLPLPVILILAAAATALTRL